MRIISGNLHTALRRASCVSFFIILILASLDGVAFAQTLELERERGSRPEPQHRFGPHPRLWLTPERMALIRDKACLDENGDPIPGCQRDKRTAFFLDWLAPGDYWGKQAWHSALGYRITGDPALAYDAIDWMRTTIEVIDNSDRGQDNFLNIGPNLRSTALVFDWCYNFLSPQERADYIAYMNQLMNELWNYSTNTTHPWDGWATGDPGNNFYYSFLIATAYVALATYGENPNAPEITFNGTTYDNLLEFVTAKIEQETIPKYLDTWGAGGGWHEGNNYGLISKRYILETFLLLRDVGARDYYRVTEFPRQAILYHLYSMQPGFLNVYPGGDLPRTTTPYDRSLMLLGAEAYGNEIEGQYAQYYANHVDLAEDWDYWLFVQPYDVLFYDLSRPERNFAELPSCYFASGNDWLNSRTGWGPDDVSVSFVCTDRIQGHQAQDQNAFLIYKNGFQATTGNLYSQWGGYQFSDAYNTILIDGQSQAYGGDWDNPTVPVHDIGNVTRFENGGDYVYIIGDASDAYYTNSDQFGNGDERLLDVFTRELVHVLPGYVVVYDRIAAKDPTQMPTWLLNTAHEPQVVGNSVIATNGGRLVNWTLLPNDYVLRTGLHPGGYSFGTPDTIDCWRTEVEPASPSPINYFLNVLLADDGAAPLPVVRRVGSAGGSAVGTQILAADRAWTLVFTTGDDPLEPVVHVSYDIEEHHRGTHLVFGLAADVRFIVKVADTATGYHVDIRGCSMTDPDGLLSSSEGTLRFDVGDPRNPDRRTPGEMPASTTVQALALHANHPNPFNPTTRIAFDLPRAARVRLTVYDATGALVSTLLDGMVGAGTREVEWNATDMHGRPVGSGVYFYRLEAGGRVLSRKMVLLK